MENNTRAKAHDTSRLSKIKIAFLYVLIAGLGLAAMTSVISLLVGEFNAIIGKTLLTIFILFGHSLLLLLILWADTKNEIGKAAVSTTIFATTFASLVTTTLGAWGVISSASVLNWTGLYFLAIGGAYIITGLLRLRTSQQAVQVAVITSIGFVGATLLVISPWVLSVVPYFDPLYFRIVAALSILSTASFLITVILRSIARSKGHKEVQRHNLSSGMLAIYIVFGVVTASAWNIGMIALLDSGSGANPPSIYKN